MRYSIQSVEDLTVQPSTKALNHAVSDSSSKDSYTSANTNFSSPSPPSLEKARDRARSKSKPKSTSVSTSTSAPMAIPTATSLPIRNQSLPSTDAPAPGLPAAFPLLDPTIHTLDSHSPQNTAPHLTQSSSLITLAQHLATKGPHKTLSTSRRIRVLFNGAIIADTLYCDPSTSALYVWEYSHLPPQFYLPMEAFVQPPKFTVRLEPGDSISEIEEHGINGISNYESPASASASTTTNIIGGTLILSVKPTSSPDAGFKHLTKMVLFAADLTGPGRELCNMVKIDFDAVEGWFEEDGPVYVHPKDPFKRIDALPSTRTLRILINEVVVARSSYSMHLYETGVPVRYYIPLTAIESSMLKPSTGKTSRCAYKGEAVYRSIEVKGELKEDVLWCYQCPNVECATIAGMWCFDGEKVDVEFEDGGRWRRMERSKSLNVFEELSRRR